VHAAPAQQTPENTAYIITCHHVKQRCHCTVARQQLLCTPHQRSKPQKTQHT
jgi:hypothetical protein